MLMLAISCAKEKEQNKERNKRALESSSNRCYSSFELLIVCLMKPFIILQTALR